MQLVSRQPTLEEAVVVSDVYVILRTDVLGQALTFRPHVNIVVMLFCADKSNGSYGRIASMTSTDE